MSLHGIGNTLNKTCDSFTASAKEIYDRNGQCESATLAQTIGLVVMIASGILAISSLATASWISAAIYLTTTLIGCEIIVITDNINKIVNLKSLIAVLGLFNASATRETVTSTIFEGTFLLKKFSQMFPEAPYTIYNFINE